MKQTNRVVVLLDDQMHERLRREAFERKLPQGRIMKKALQSHFNRLDGVSRRQEQDEAQ